jgi:serralysin
MCQLPDGTDDGDLDGSDSNVSNGNSMLPIDKIANVGVLAQFTNFGSISDLASYLYQGYFVWDGEGGKVHWWTSSPVTVNITALTTTEQNLAQLALADWSRVANISFSYTTGAAQITYNHNGTGTAQTNWNYDSSGHMTSATIDISSDWASAGNGVNNYLMQTYLHETGHAIGLGHQGAYNNTGTYGTNNVYSNDTWQWSVMSYFNQSNYGGASYDYVVTPEMADIYAVQHLYGARSSTGGLTYGFHSNAGTPFDFTAYTGTPAFTIYNNAYNNTLDASGYFSNQVLDATPGHWSSIGGKTDNIGIYLTTNINNLVGGYGSDLIIPNANLTGTLTGGGGFDTFQNTEFGLSGYNITDMNFGDRLNFTNGSLGSFTYARNGTSLSYGNGGNSYFLTLSNNAIGHFALSSDPTYGGVDLKLMQPTATSDFSDSGKSDILWRDSSGTLVDWTMNGSTIVDSHSLNAAPDASWQIADIADFNGDGHSDILWRNSAGSLVDWSMNGSSIAVSQTLGAAPDASWSIAGSADFNGDHAADILWRNSNGTLVDWTMNGGTIAGNQTLNAAPDASWNVAGLGDFNGDGRSDILWRNTNGALVDWSMNGSSIADSQVLGAAPDASWSVAGIGDFLGNGHSDILWRNTNGSLVEWIMNGGTIATGQSIAAAPDASWSIVQIGDFDGNGRSDILWRQSTTGQLADWQMNGWFIDSSQALQAAPGASWQTQSHPTISAV